MMARLQNQINELIQKLAKQKAEHDNSLQEAKIKPEKLKKQIEELKAQSSIIDRENTQKIEEELKKSIAANKVLNDDKMKVLYIIRNFEKNLVEQIE